jgi:hypothetical protein
VKYEAMNVPKKWQMILAGTQSAYVIQQLQQLPQ